MSKVVDEKIVSMQFDNSKFENNVKTTMSTLDKLKKALGFEGATKGMADVQSASSKVNFNGMTNAIESVSLKFSALQVMATTALVNITNAALNAGKNIVNALAVQPVTEGFKEYELMLGAIQTTMAGTGKTAEEVEKELVRLDDYADKTIYSTADMLNNLPKFTNAGVELETATTAMIGIANATALAGGDANKAGIAFYNLGQAIGTGYLTRMDYNSINNAGIATVQWKEAMIEAAISAGTLTEASEGLYKVGNTTMTMQQLFIDGLQHQWASTDVMLDVFNQYGDETTELGSKSWEAAQKIKTFTMMMESLKATAATGWKDTWTLLFGDLDTAAKFWTTLSDFISGIITGVADWRNNLLDGALNRSFKNISEGINNVLKPIKSAASGLESINTALVDYTKVVDDIIYGKYKNAPERFQLLEEAGYDWAHAQNLVNEKLGNGYRYATKYSEAQGEIVETTQETTMSNEELIESLIKMSDEELKAMGYTDEHIKSLRELEELSSKLGMTIKDTLSNLDQMDGRWILWNSFANLGRSLVSIFNSLKDAWSDVFPPLTSDILFNIIAGFHKLSEIIKNNVINNSDNLKRTLRGLLSIIGLITDVLSIGFKIALEVVKAVLSVFNLDLLEFTALIGDAIYNFREWIHENNLLFKAIQYVTTAVVEFVNSLVDWNKVNEKIQNGLKNFTDTLNILGDNFKEWIQGFKDTEDIPKYLIEGLWNGLKTFGSLALDGFIAFGNMIINTFKNVLGIHSPSTVFFEFGLNIIQGLINGIKSFLPKIGEAMMAVGNKVIEFFKDLNITHVIIALVTGAIYLLSKQVVSAVTRLTNAIAKPLEAVGDMLRSFGNAAEDFGKAKKYDSIGNMLKNIAIAILILAAALFVISKISTEDIIKASITLGVLSAGLLALSYALSKIDFGKLKVSTILKTSILLFTLGNALILFAISLKLIGSMTTQEVLNGLLGLSGIMVLLMSFMALMGKISQASSGNIKQFTSMISRLSFSLLLMIAVIKLSSLINGEDLIKTIGVMGTFGILIAMMGVISRLAKTNLKGFNSMILTISISMLLMVGVIKLSGLIEYSDLTKAIGIMTTFGVLILAMNIMTRFAGSGVAKLSALLLAVSTSMLLMVGVIKIAGMLKTEEIKNGLIVIGFLSLFLSGLIAVTKFAGKHAFQAGVMLLGVATSMLILTAALFILGKMNTKELDQALGVLIVLEALFAGLMIISGVTSQASVMVINKLILSIVALVGSLIILTFIDSDKLATATKSIVSLILSLVSLMIASNFTKLATDISKTMATMIVVIGLLGLLIWGLTSIPNIDKADSITKSISILLLSLSGALMILSNININIQKAAINITALTAMAIPLLAFSKVMSGMKSPNVSINDILILGTIISAMSGLMFILDKMKLGAKSTAGAITALSFMVIPLALFAGSLHILNGVKVDPSTVTALISLISVMTVLLIVVTILGAIIIGTAGVGAGAIALGIASLAAMILPLLGFIYVLKQMKDINGVSKNVEALVFLTTAMTLLLIPLTLIGALIIATGGVILAGMLGLVAMVLPMLVFIEALKKMNGIENITTNVIAITYLLSSMTDILIKLALISPFLVIANYALLGFIGVITILGILVTAVGTLMSAFPKLEEFIKTGLPMLELLSLGLGRMLGNLIGGIMTGISDSIVNFGENLSNFALAIIPFIDTMKLMDQQFLNGIGILTAAILLLTAATIIDGITSVLTGGISFAKLGIELSKFALATLPFITIMSKMKPEVSEGVKNIANALLYITAADLLSNITKFIGGGNAIDTFTKQLPTLGEGLRSFVDSLGIFSDEQVTTVDCAGRAIKALAEAAKDLPNDGGWVGAIVGENSIGAFGDQLPGLGTNLSSFVSNLGTFSEAQVTTTDCAGRAIKALAEAAQELPNDGGWVAAIVGENSIGAFGDQLPGLGTNLNSFVSNLGTFSEAQVTTVDCAGKAITALATAAKELPSEGGFWQKIFGENSLAKFAEDLPDLGTALKDFCSGLGTFTLGEVSSISAAVEAIKAIAQLGGLNLKDTGDQLPGFGDKLKDFGSKFKEFIIDLTSVSEDQTSSAYTAIDSIINTVSRLSSLNLEPLSSFINTLSEFGKNGLQAFIDGYSNADALVSASNGIIKLTDFIKTTIDNDKESIKNKFKELGQEGINGLNDEGIKSQTQQIGKDFVNGFVIGINNNKYLARSAGSSVGKEALLAAKAAIDSNSPSEETKKLGHDFDNGLSIGIFDLANKVYNSAYKVGETAKNGLSKAIQNISSVINNDAEGPIIRPVLDLSEVETGAKGISNLFGGQSLALAGNLASVNSAAINSNQNGNNDDVISAIKNLGNSLSGSSNTYNINGVTYDDGSNINTAVEAIVQAAKVERRK